ncbi:hypothetical protein CW751_02095 [Brumimicrobium salinarum]|uniref:Thioredoxin domain-containing protein n=1 Tax=Brumimicrobium salinarum TaxID=2058658 RepID=A0A2I0R6E2_9FLAO|nr:choice-of-anchor J domain-containing protein [Brumimicrobium salinarum]PKR82151.1 hypothetical protein CW751_02095 [Brumimicrobium salinarum]
MNKLLLGASLLFATGLSAQTYFEDDFSSPLSNNWTLIDGDEDNNNWLRPQTQQGATVEMATSKSYDNANGTPLTPDNWMISEVIDLSSAVGVTMLSWIARAQDQSFPDEKYSVYVGTASDTTSFIANGANFTDVVGYTGDDWSAESIDVSGFNGQTIYVAFRHHDVTDQFWLNIDDVKVAKVPDNDLSLNGLSLDKTIIGDRTVTVEVKNTGVNTVNSFDVSLDFDGDVYTENVTGLNLNFGDVHSLNINITGVTAGVKTISAELTTSDDVATNNSISGSLEILNPIPQYIATDSEGNSFNLHDRLSNGQAIVLDFMASWCNPCLQSTPALSEFIENNGSGQGDVEALAITVEQTDDASVLNGLNWNGGFYEYPKFPYSATNVQHYSHYASNHELNAGGSIPFFLLICPDVQNPELSTIVKSDEGYSNGMFNAYQTALDQCPTATMDVVEMTAQEVDFKAYPNPANNVVNIDFELNTQEETTISIINTVGQTVVVNNLGSVTGVQSIQLNVADLEAGMYIVKVKTSNGEQTKRISVAK